MNKKKMFASATAFLLSLCIFANTPCHAYAKEKQDNEIVFADIGWDSVKLNNELAGLVAEKVFGYTWSSVPVSTPIAHEALLKGEIDVHMEEWTDNISNYIPDREKNLFTELGINFNDNYQGFYIPKYIADEYPDLKTVNDLAKYPQLFPDPENSSKAIIYGGIPGWQITEIMEKKVKAYGLDEQYTYICPGSNAAMDTTITKAVDNHEPIVTYYWEPTWLMGKYDFVLLEDSPYNPEKFPEGIGECPAVTVTVAASNDFYNNNPEYCEFLSNYSLPSATISEALAYMQDTGCNHKDAARWLLQESHPELIDEWLNPEQAEFLKASLTDEESPEKKSLSDFPIVVNIDTNSIDKAVRSFAVWAGKPLHIIQSALGGIVNFFHSILSHVPWFILAAAVLLLGWRARGKFSSGLIYAILLCLVGVAGLWDEMRVTLSIVLSSVLLALLTGLPVGILVSCSERANRIVRPILDTMQTMPVFVYLIPAMLLFGMGNASGVIATVVYAIVPVIRLTSLGIRQVDKEVVEAAVSFGSTRIQTLFKVQIPQAMPTIMTGVNQTLMMAMAMVVTCSMIGARGLGMEVLDAVNRIEIGRGLVAGGCVVVVAVVLDRLTQTWVKRDKNSNRKADV